MNTETSAAASPGMTAVATLSRRSLAWRMILPVPLAVIAAIAASWLIVPQVIADNATAEAVTASQQIAAQFKTIRGYYTDKVVGKVTKEGSLKPAIDHEADAKAIPLPATMIHDLSALLAKQDTAINLYSQYPFPNRKNRPLDAFQREAWDYLVANPSMAFSRKEMRDGKNVVRVAVADTMAVQACIGCHNSRADSPKRDWKIGDVRGVLEVTSLIDTQLAQGQRLSSMIMIGAVVIGLVLLAITLLVTRSVTRPIGGLVAAMSDLASGNLQTQVPGVGRRDEMGDMAGAVQVFKDSMIEADDLRAEQTRIAEQGRAQSRAAMHRLADEFQTTVGSIIESVSSASSDLETAATSLAKNADTAKALTTTVAAASEEASVNVQSVASASEELSGSVDEISRQMQESSRIATEAVRQADATDGRIADLSQAATRIGDVLKLITAVAEQTNLLALNATIEAARAGEAGRGFAVVAQEVKALAGQTAKATDEIGAQIAGMQAVTKESVSAIKAIGATIGRIAEISATIAAAVEEQGAATREISRNVQRAAAGTAQVTSSIAEVNGGAVATGSASTHMLASAQTLSGESNRLKAEVQKFLAGVRAA